jgi:hypothetical protein
VKQRKRVWVHRTATLICVLLAVPAVLWWSDSVLFVILISLATQGYASLSASEAADDRQLTERLDRIEALLDQRRPSD